MEQRNVPKDPKIARVFTIDTGPSEQYNALVPSHFDEKWDAWYFWIPMPMGTYYASDLLKMMLVIMETDLCVLLNHKPDDLPKYNTGVYWIIDLVEKDFEDGSAGIIEKVRGEIETVLSTERFPEDEKRRLRDEVEEGFQEWMRERKESGVYSGRQSPATPDVAPDPTPASTPAPRPAPKNPTRPSKAVPIVDPKTRGKEKDNGASSSKSDTTTTAKKPLKVPPSGTVKSEAGPSKRTPTDKPRGPSRAVPIVNAKDAPAQASSLQSTGQVMSFANNAAQAVASSAFQGPVSMAPHAPLESSQGHYSTGPGVDSVAHPAAARHLAHGHHPGAHIVPQPGALHGTHPATHPGAQHGAHPGVHPRPNPHGALYVPLHAQSMRPQAGIPLPPRPSVPPGGFQYGPARLNNLAARPHPGFAASYGGAPPAPVHGQGFTSVSDPFPGTTMGATRGPYQYVPPSYQFPGGPHGFVQSMPHNTHHHFLGPGNNFPCPPFSGPPRAPFPCAQPRDHGMAPRVVDSMTVRQDLPTSFSVIEPPSGCPDARYPGPQFERDMNERIAEATPRVSQQSTPRLTKPDIFMDETVYSGIPSPMPVAAGNSRTMSEGTFAVPGRTKPVPVVRLPNVQYGAASMADSAHSNAGSPASDANVSQRTVHERLPVASPRRMSTPRVRLPPRVGDASVSSDTSPSNSPNSEAKGLDRSTPEGAPTGPRHSTSLSWPLFTDGATESSPVDRTPPADAPTGPRNQSPPVEYMMLQGCACSSTTLGDYIDAALAKADAIAAQAKSKCAEGHDGQENAEK